MSEDLSKPFYTPDTVHKLAKLTIPFPKLQSIEIYDIDESFDFATFCTFIQVIFNF